jgi:plasmid maintenance system antidote protein VapI
VSAETALRIARYFGTSPNFWVRLQAKYDVEIAKDTKAALIERDVRPREAAPPVKPTAIHRAGRQTKARA